MSAERLKMVFLIMDVRLVIMDLRWDTLVEAFTFPICAFVLSQHGKDVFLVFFNYFNRIL